MTMGAERRKPRQGDREKAEARKMQHLTEDVHYIPLPHRENAEARRMLQSEQDAALNRGCTLYTLAT